jgi:hypothetical protein
VVLFKREFSYFEVLAVIDYNEKLYMPLAAKYKNSKFRVILNNFKRTGDMFLLRIAG